MAGNDKITVVTVCDNHYLVLLAALIKSIEQNHKTGEPIALIIVEDHIASAGKQKLERSVNAELIEITWIPMTDAIPRDIILPADKSSYPVNIYVRVFIPWFVPPEIKKVLYLDVDMVMLGEISELWCTDITGFPLGAVQDSRIKTAGNSWGGIKNYKELGFAHDMKYFNTGLLLIDTEKWRNADIAHKVLNCVQVNRAYLNYPDQYALNVVFADNWFSINPIWNHFVTSDETETPKLIHFIERKPIYRSYANSPLFQQIFYQYLDQTEWKNSKKISEFSRYVKKIKNLLNKINVK